MSIDYTNITEQELVRVKDGLTGMDWSNLLRAKLQFLGNCNLQSFEVEDQKLILQAHE